MKILKLKFKNLNSLKGEWSIDFTNSDFNSGIQDYENHVNVDLGFGGIKQ